MSNQNISSHSDYLTKLLNSFQRQAMSCEQAYVEGLKKRVFRLKDIRQFLAQSMAESVEARNEHEKWKWLLAATQSLKLACDVTIEFVASNTGPAGLAIKQLYGVSTMAVDLINTPQSRQNQKGKKVATKRILDDAATIADKVMENARGGKALAAKFKINNRALKVDVGFGTALSMLDFSTQAFEIIETVSEQPSGIDAGIVSIKKQIKKVIEKLDSLESELVKCGQTVA